MQGARCKVHAQLARTIVLPSQLLSAFSPNAVLVSEHTLEHHGHQGTFVASPSGAAFGCGIIVLLSLTQQAAFDQRGQQSAHVVSCSAAFANFLWQSETAHSSPSFAASPRRRRRVDGRHVHCSANLGDVAERSTNALVMDKHEDQDPRTNRRSKHAFKACTARPDLYRQPRRFCVIGQDIGCCLLRQNRNDLGSHDILHPTSPRLKWSAPAVVGVIQVRKGCYTTYRPRLLCILQTAPSHQTRSHNQTKLPPHVHLTLVLKPRTYPNNRNESTSHLPTNKRSIPSPPYDTMPRYMTSLGLLGF